VDGYLPVGSLGMICALGSSHKSWLLVDMALAVAKGRPWLGAFTTGEPKRVLYLDYENNEDETARRILGLEPEPVETFHMSVMPDLFLTDPKFLPEIENLARQYDFIAIDSLSGGSEDVNENDTKFAQCLRQMKRAGAKTGCGFVVLHHSRKPMRGRDGEEIEETNKKSKPRGTNAIFNALDSLLDVDNISDSQSHITHAKHRGARKLDPFTICIEGLAPEPTRLFVLSVKELEERKKMTRLRGIFALYKKALVPNAMSGGDLAKVLKRRRQAVTDELAEFVKLEWLSLDGFLYSLPVEAGSTPSRGPLKNKGVGKPLRLVTFPDGPDDGKA
jgi:AAA domain-containing protein